MIEIMVVFVVLSFSDDPPAPPKADSEAKVESPENPPPKRLRKKAESPPTTEEKKDEKQDEAPRDEGRPLPKPEEVAPKSDLDQALERSLGGGLDEEEDDPVTRIASRMSEAEAELARKESRPGSIPVQEKIVVELDELIQSLENPPPSPKDQQQPKPKDAKKKKQKQGQSRQQRQALTRTPESRSGEPKERIGPPAPVREKLTPQEEERMVWGHLSEMLREEMGQFAKESFLPQYRDEIERYYTEIARRSKERVKP